MNKPYAFLAALVASTAFAAGNPPPAGHPPVTGDSAKTAPAARNDLGAMHAGVSASPDVGEVKVPKATGADARTVAEITTGASALNNKPVVLRAKVVKFTADVMGKNWAHVRDGSGKASDGTHDILITTKDTTKVGDVVVVRGVVRTNVDIGSGYFYKVLVDNASLQK